MIECVGVIGWIALATHVEVTFRYLHDGVKCVAYRQLPAGTLKTPHEIDRQILKLKQGLANDKDSFTTGARNARALFDSRVAAGPREDDSSAARAKPPRGSRGVSRGLPRGKRTKAG